MGRLNGERSLTLSFTVGEGAYVGRSRYVRVDDIQNGWMTARIVPMRDGGGFDYANSTTVKMALGDSAGIANNARVVAVMLEKRRVRIRFYAPRRIEITRSRLGYAVHIQKQRVTEETLWTE